MSKKIKIFSIIALVVVVVAGGLYILRNILESSSQPQNNAQENKSSGPIGALNIAVAPEGIGTPGWKPSANYRPEYKDVFSVGDQVMFDFSNVAKSMNVEAKMYDQNDQAADFSEQFSLKPGNDGNCCFNLPQQPGKYTIKVTDDSGVVLTRSLEIK